MAVYDKYSTNNVFQYQFANIICNQLMEGLLAKEFPDFNDHFALGGAAADCFYSTSSGPIENIQFKTDVREIYIFLAQNLNKICPDLLRLETYEERIIAHFQGVYVEFYLLSSMTTSPHLGIYLTSD